MHRFTASDAQAGDWFGHAVASYDKTVVISALISSTIYLFDLNSKEELHKLKATNGMVGDLFGDGVAISGNIIMVSAPHNGIGAVYTFDVSNGTQLLKYTNTDTPKSYHFGAGSSGMVTHASKNVGIVGHREEDRGVHEEWRRGAVYVFDLGTGLQIRKITSARSAVGDLFGSSLVVFGDFLLVGAPGVDSNKGSVYVFDVSDNWREITSFGQCGNLST